MTDLSGIILEGKYELIRLIGEGGMGAVYEATHKLIGRRLAVKFLHNQYTSNEEVVIRFQREARAAAAIGHENIIEVTDMGQTEDGAPFLVMEYLDGCDVQHLLKRKGALSLEQAADIMVQSLSALQAAHHVGIIHRDMKPENIFLIEKFDRKRFVKILDFGISKFRALDGDAKGLTQTGTVLGTPYYMSPEQASGSSDIGIKSDIYAMGVILFQMLTGKLPYDAPNYNALLVKILTEEPPDPLEFKPDLPEDLVETIRVAMARNVDNRFESCAAFRERLLPYVPGASASFRTKMALGSQTAIRATLSTHTPLEMARSRGPMTREKRKWPIVVGALGSLAAATVLAFFLFGNELDPKPRFSSTRSTLPPQSASANPGDETPPKAAIETPATDAEKPKQITLSISATPDTATIAVDGITGENPYRRTFYKDAQNHKIDITAKGYKTLTRDISFDGDHALSFALAPEEPLRADNDATAPLETPHTAAKKERDNRHRDRTKTPHKKVGGLVLKEPSALPDVTKTQTEPKTGSKPETAPQTAAEPKRGPTIDSTIDFETKKKKRQIDFKDPW